jgi:hypothetical protein
MGSHCWASRHWHSAFHELGAVPGMKPFGGMKSVAATQRERGYTMSGILRGMSLSYAAGSFGALMNSLALWVFGALGITVALGAKLTPSLTVAFLYPRLVWGGLWGFLFLLPFFKGSWIKRGIVFGLAPALAQLLLVLPFKFGKGWLGLDLGPSTPLFVLLFCIIWGLATAWLLTKVE